MIDQVERWGIFELTMTGPADGNPFAEVDLTAEFQYRNRIVAVDGFYDGDGVYKIRFSPDQVGRWWYRTSSTAAELDGVSGEFDTVLASAGNHGPVGAVGGWRFEYADGTRHESYGTTCYHWTHTGDEDHERRTLESLAGSPFNKIRMCLLPTAAMTPARIAFAGDSPDNLDRTRFNPDFFRHFEGRIADLLALGIEADVIIFHPYDKGHWGVDNMTPEQDRFLVRYVVARLAAFRNVWWSMSNEFDFNKAKTMEDWDRLLQFLQRIDPYRRMASIHNGTAMFEHASIYDFGKPWTTHQSIQHWDARLTREWREQHPKPVVLDELGYEGDIDRRWGNLTGQTITRRFWDGMTTGGFVGHGECFVDTDHRWISSGGTLIGESPVRIAFLRKIISEGPANWLGARDHGYRLDYFGDRQPAFYQAELGEADHTIELIDTWRMTIDPLPGTYRGRCLIPLGRTDLAVRIRRIEDAS